MCGLEIVPLEILRVLWGLQLHGTPLKGGCIAQGAESASLS